MNKTNKLLIGILFSQLSACSTQSIQPEHNKPSAPVDSEITITPISNENSLLAPDLTIVKAGKELKLVRIMEGGVCKDNMQGVVGMFKLYANPNDIMLIEQKSGTRVFADFEQDIQHFSMLALQHAINNLDFTAAKSTQESLAKELTSLFSKFIENDISQFETKTSLTIDVLPIQSSLTIFLDGCEIPHEH